MTEDEEKTLDERIAEMRADPAVQDLDQRALQDRMYYDRASNPITFTEWVRLFERSNFAYRVVQQEEIGLYRVSTVWLGINYSFGFGPPLIFETMVFLAGTPEDTWMMRYSTEDEALAGHEAVCAEIRVLDERAADQERFRVNGPDDE